MEKRTQAKTAMIFCIVTILIITAFVPAACGFQTTSRLGVQGTLWGFVTDLDGNPIVNARVEATPLSNYSLSKNALSQAGGYYTMDLPEDDYRVTVSRLGFFPVERAVNMYRGESVRSDFQLEKVPPINCVLDGKITNNDTTLPVPNAYVLIMDAARSYNRSTDAGLNGNYSFNLYTGDFIMFSIKSGFLPRFIGGIHLVSGQTKTLNFTLYPQPAMDARTIGDISYKFDNGTTDVIPYAGITIFDYERDMFTDITADANGHFDINLYEGTFLFFAKAENFTTFKYLPINVTTKSGQITVQNFQLIEMAASKVKTDVNIASFTDQSLHQNLSTFGRMGDGGMPSVNFLRFMLDLFFGNADQYASEEECSFYVDMMARDLRNGLGLYDTKDLLTIDGKDFIFDQEFDSANIELAGHIFSETPFTIDIAMGAQTNGTIDDKLPIHQVWMNQTLATGDQVEDVTFTFSPIFTFKNFSAHPNLTFSEPTNGTLHVVPLKDPDPNDDQRSEVVTFQLVDRISPVAKAGDDRTVNEDVDVMFDGSGSSDNFGILYYVWEYGDGQSKNSSSPTAVHNYPQPGTYQVNLTVIDKVLLKAKDSLIMTVKDITSPMVTLETVSTTVKEDVQVLFKANASDNVAVTNITWWIGKTNPTHLGNGTILNHTFTTPGKYTISVNVSDLAGHKVQSSVDMTVTDETPPVANLGANRTVNEDTEIAFDGSASSDNVAVTSYSWSFGDGSTNVTGVTTAHTYSSPGNYAVTLTVLDAVGHKSTRTIWVLVNDVTYPTASFTSKTSALTDKKMMFNATLSTDNVGISSYHWDFGDKSTDQGPIVYHKFKKQGTYNVNLTVTDPSGLNSSYMVKIRIDQPQNQFLNTFCIGVLLTLIFVGGIGAVLLYFRLKHGGYKIEEAFVIYNDGRLIKHISAHPTESADKEIIASMLTAVQDFVKDSLKKKDGEFLGKLEFGKKTKILIERGNKTYLAIVLSGHDPESLRADLRKMVKQVEDKYSEPLEKWDGDISAFDGIDETVIALIER